MRTIVKTDSFEMVEVSPCIRTVELVERTAFKFPYILFCRTKIGPGFQYYKYFGAAFLKEPYKASTGQICYRPFFVSTIIGGPEKIFVSQDCYGICLYEPTLFEPDLWRPSTLPIKELIHRFWTTPFRSFGYDIIRRHHWVAPDVIDLAELCTQDSPNYRGADDFVFARCRGAYNVS